MFQVLFIYIDTDQEDNKRVMEFFGLADSDIPDYRIIKMQENMAKFKPDKKDLSYEAVKAFTNDVVTGTVKVSEIAFLARFFPLYNHFDIICLSLLV